MTKLFSPEWEQEVFERSSPHEQLLMNATANANQILAELRFIRWLLLVLVLLAVTAMFIWAPAGWWHTPFWAL